jgi:Zinc finger, C2H2 type
VVYACTACEYNAKKFILLRNHFKRHLRVGRFQCNSSDCLNTYSQKSDLNFHKSTIHGLKVCRKCNLEFENAESFLEHKNSHTTTVASKTKQAKVADQNRSCPDCGKVLQTPGGLFTHRKMHLEKPQYRCEVRHANTLFFPCTLLIWFFFKF